VQNEVKPAWLAARTAEAKQQAYAAMRGKYEVRIPATPDAAANPGSAAAPSPD